MRTARSNDQDPASAADGDDGPAPDQAARLARSEEALRRLENCPEQASTFRSLNTEQRGSFLEAADGQGEKIDQQLTDTWLEKIHEVTREQNRRLVKEWDMPLADYRYLI